MISLHDNGVRFEQCLAAPLSLMIELEWQGGRL
jgi:hypothetical protein